MPPVIRPAEIAVVLQRIGHGEIEVALRSPGEAVKAQLDVPQRLSPDQTLDGNPLATCHRLRQQI